MDMRTVVTGGVGFIGSHLVDRLLEGGNEVLIVDDFSNGYEENLPDPEPDSIRVVREDVSSKATLDVVRESRPELIYHLACYPRSISFSDPEHCATVNLISTYGLCEVARSMGSGIVFSSNSGLIGEPRYLPVDEEHPVHPTTPYDVHKLASEHAIRIYSESCGIGGVVLRFASVYGPRQRPNDRLGWRPIVPEWISRLSAGEPIVIESTGDQTRDFVYVDDVVDAVLRAGKKALEKRVFGGPYLIGTGIETSINQLHEILRSMIGGTSETKHAARKLGDIDRMAYSNKKARSDLGWEPETRLQDGLKSTVEWWTTRLGRTVDRE